MVVLLVIGNRRGRRVRANVQRKNLGVNLASSFALGPKSDLLDAVLDAVLLLAGYVHYVEGQEFAGYFGEGDVEMDFHSLACCIPSWSASVFVVCLFASSTVYALLLLG